jgi:hypothetical protein
MLEISPAGVTDRFNDIRFLPVNGDAGVEEGDARDVGS